MKESNTKIFFYTSWLSNFKECKIIDTITNLSFTCSEQVYMWQKANFFGDVDIRQALEDIKVHNPNLSKILGGQVKNYNENMWECVRYGFMVYANYLKYSQNPDLAQKLLSTKDKVLVEASPSDLVWGIGLGENQDISILDDEKNWRGRNLLGESLMRVRILLT